MIMTLYEVIMMLRIKSKDPEPINYGAINTMIDNSNYVSIDYLEWFHEQCEVRYENAHLDDGASALTQANNLGLIIDPVVCGSSFDRQLGFKMINKTNIFTWKHGKWDCLWEP